MRLGTDVGLCVWEGTATWGGDICFQESEPGWKFLKAGLDSEIREGPVIHSGGR